MARSGGCGCGHDDERLATGARPGRYAGEERVGDVARDPKALGVLKRFGLNHCCAGDLSLRAGAAAAGAELATLLRALDEAAGAPGPAESDRPRAVELDVRGLEPPQPMVRVLEQLEALGPGGVLTVLHDRRPVFLYPQLDARGAEHETDEPEPGLVRIVIRKSRP